MYTVAIAGVTGAVGEQMLDILEDREFPIDQLVPLASERSRGKTIQFRGQSHEVEVLAERSFEEIDLALFSAGSGVVAEHADRILEQGTVIVDNSSAFRYDPDIPLVVPEINPDALDDHDGLIANPNCSTTQLVMALAPVHSKFGIDRIVVSTYQSTSGSGERARRECWDQTKDVVNEEPMREPDEFAHPIAFNAIPDIGEMLDDHDDYTKEEMKMVWETRKILQDDSIEVSPTAVRIPVLNGHGESVNVETERECDPDDIRHSMDTFPGIDVLDDPDNDVYPTNRIADGEDPVYVGRIRRDSSVDHGFNCWIVADNLRKGAALNTIQIGEELAERELVRTQQPV